VIWIGAKKYEGAWSWDNGDPLNGENWDVSQPTNNGICVAMHTNFKWHNFSCSSALAHIVCERKI